MFDIVAKRNSEHGLNDVLEDKLGGGSDMFRGDRFKEWGNKSCNLTLPICRTKTRVHSLSTTTVILLRDTYRGEQQKLELELKLKRADKINIC